MVIFLGEVVDVVYICDNDIINAVLSLWILLINEVAQNECP